jgi:hypothetical protein
LNPISAKSTLVQILITSLWYLQTLLIINHNLYLIQFIITKQQLTYDRQFGLFVCVNETILNLYIKGAIRICISKGQSESVYQRDNQNLYIKGAIRICISKGQSESVYQRGNQNLYIKGAIRIDSDCLFDIQILIASLIYRFWVTNPSLRTT